MVEGAVDSTVQEITAAGGTLTLPGDVAAVFEPGFLTGAAPVELSLSDVAEAYPKEIAKTYKGGEPVARTTVLEIPVGALAAGGGRLADQPKLTLSVPAAAPPLTDGERLVAEVHLHLGDGEHRFYFEPYGDGGDRHGDSSEAAYAFTFRAQQLRALGKATQSHVRITVRPVKLSSVQVAPQALPDGFVRETVVDGLDAGIAFDFAPDGRIFIAEKKGVVKVFQDGQLLATPFIDIQSQVNNISDRGLLGVAVHPDFPNRPYVYLLFTYDPPEVRGRSGLAGPDGGGARVARLIRVTADAARGYNVAVPGSDVVLLGKNSTFANIGDPAMRNSPTPSCGPLEAYVMDCLPADELSHTIGTVKFGTDGALYVGNGDGASFNAVQEYAIRSVDIYSLAGKVLRIDPMTGRGLPDNPFYLSGDPDNNRSKVYNYGMRNPFRFAIHPVSGEPYIGDVGWNTWEEVNFGYGRNFGWPCYEGGQGTSIRQGGYASLDRCRAFYENGNIKEPAIYAYEHGGGGSSVQVGDFYTGTRYPAEYRGALFLSDINQGWIRYLKLTPSGGLASAHDFATNTQGITQMSAGPLGDLYLMDIYSGVLSRLRYVGDNAAPLTAAADWTPQDDAPLAVNFSSAGSTGTGTLTYAWTFGDGATSAEANPQHTYTAAGTYRVGLRVTDESGDSATTTLTVRVGNSAPTPTILSPAPGARYTVGDTVPFSGAASDPEDGELPESALRWTVRMHHNDHVHLDAMPPSTGAAGSYLTLDHGDNTYVELCLTATDSLQETATTCVSVYPRTVAYTLDTVPSGLRLPWEGTLRTTPFTVTTLVNAEQQLFAPATQGGYTFSSWSNGGARDQTVRVGETPMRFVATYASASGKQDQTVSFTSSAPTTATVGGTYAVRATSTSGLPVSFASATPSVCGVAGNTVTFSAAGTCTVRASQAGNATYNPAPDVTQSVTVSAGAPTKQNQTITFTSAAPSAATVGGSYTVRATATSGLTVSFSSTTGGVCTVSGSTVSFVGAGTCRVAANQAGNGTYNAAPEAAQSFAVGAVTPPPSSALEPHLIDFERTPANRLVWRVSLNQGVIHTGTGTASRATVALFGKRLVNSRLSTGNDARVLNVRGSKRLTITRKGTNTPHPTGGSLQLMFDNQPTKRVQVQSLTLTNLSSSALPAGRANVKLFRGTQLVRQISVPALSAGASTTLTTAEAGISRVEVAAPLAFAVDDVAFSTVRNP